MFHFRRPGSYGGSVQSKPWETPIGTEQLRVVDPHHDRRTLLDNFPDSAVDSLVAAAMQAHISEMARLASSLDNVLAAAAKSPKLVADAVQEFARHVVPRWHFAMLNDTERNDALVVALERRVRPGSHVLDIGSGTGLLAMMAARAGAARVTSCEANPLLAEIARQVVHAHGLSDVVTIIPKMSTDIRVGEDIERPADLIVSEIVDCGLIGEGLLPTMRHARANLLAGGGELMPASGRLVGFLVESSAMAGLNRVNSAGGYDVRAFNITTTRGHLPVRLRIWPHRPLCEPMELVSFDLLRGSLDDGSRRIEVPVVASGQAHGLVVWFELDLGAGIVLRNSPENLCSHWMQALVPFERPLPVAAETTVEVRLRWSGSRLFAN